MVASTFAFLGETSVDYSFVMLITAVVLVQGKGMVCCVRSGIPFHVEHPFLREQQAGLFLGFVCGWFCLFVCLMLSVRCFQLVWFWMEDPGISVV